MMRTDEEIGIGAYGTLLQWLLAAFASGSCFCFGEVVFVESVYPYSGVSQ
ncbi:hypothetical protein AIOGIFDO_00897 [Candidatus Methanoperedenaceae archaeon GB37]|nr:hypothetical protein AIOGIFDO_00897 [Candidatus Methanoperedenaceae archaeon GB37]